MNFINIIEKMFYFFNKTLGHWGEKEQQIKQTILVGASLGKGKY